MINVLQYNPTSNSRIKAPQKREIVAFKHQLEQAGLEVTMRVSHGRDASGDTGKGREADVLSGAGRTIAAITMNTRIIFKD